MCPCSIKSRRQSAVFITSDRKLCLIPIAKCLLRSYDRLHRYVFDMETADSHQIVADFILLVLQLFFISKRLQLASSALAMDRALWIYAVWGRFQQFHQPGVSVCFFELCDFCADFIAYKRILDKKSHRTAFRAVPICLLANSRSIRTQINNFQVY